MCCMGIRSINLFSRLGVLVGVGLMALGSYLFSRAGLISLSASVDSGPNDATIMVLEDHDRAISIHD